MTLPYLSACYVSANPISLRLIPLLSSPTVFFSWLRGRDLVVKDSTHPPSSERQASGSRPGTASRSRK